ncbi:MAG: hypothetical protein J6B85_10375 [Lachnospiraceae bacterium]|nr:hypothetical protein [Lachnospiraceae bacterium]
MDKILGIFDFETDFSNNLMDYMNRRKGFDFHVRVFTNVESLNACLKEMRIDILMLGEDVAELFEDRLCERQNIGQICLLSESQHVREGTRYPVIFKFQSAEGMIREVLALYEESGNLAKQAAVLGKTKIYSVYSPCGGSGKTCLALAAALELSRKGETLYVGFEPYSALKVLMKQQPEQGISDLIYYLKQSKTAFAGKQRSIVCRRDALDYIAGPANGLDLCEMDAEDAGRWLTELEQDTYRHVVIDIGIISEAVMTLLRSSEEVLVPVGGGFLEQEKYACFLSQLERAGESDIIKRLKKLKLPQDELLIDREFGLWQLQDGKLGHFVRELL